MPAGRGTWTAEDSHSQQSNSEESDSDYREIEESAWDEDLEMASRDITPGTFSGQRSEEARTSPSPVTGRSPEPPSDLQL